MGGGWHTDEPGRRWQVSKDGGIFPEWSSDGDELFYLDLNNFLMAVAVDLEGDTFVPGESSALFQTRTTTDKGDPFSVSPDAERILIIETQEDAAASQINLLVGWFRLQVDCLDQLRSDDRSRCTGQIAGVLQGRVYVYQESVGRCRGSPQFESGFCPDGL
jgi:hypothetical protein